MTRRLANLVVSIAILALGAVNVVKAELRVDWHCPEPPKDSCTEMVPPAPGSDFVKWQRMFYDITHKVLKVKVVKVREIVRGLDAVIKEAGYDSTSSFNPLGELREDMLAAISVAVDREAVRLEAGEMAGYLSKALGHIEDAAKLTNDDDVMDEIEDAITQCEYFHDDFSATPYAATSGGNKHVRSRLTHFQDYCTICLPVMQAALKTNPERYLNSGEFPELEKDCSELGPELVQHAIQERMSFISRKVDVTVDDELAGSCNGWVPYIQGPYLYKATDGSHDVLKDWKHRGGCSVYYSSAGLPLIVGTTVECPSAFTWAATECLYAYRSHLSHGLGLFYDETVDKVSSVFIETVRELRSGGVGDAQGKVEIHFKALDGGSTGSLKVNSLYTHLSTADGNAFYEDPVNFHNDGGTAVWTWAYDSNHVITNIRMYYDTMGIPYLLLCAIDGVYVTNGHYVEGSTNEDIDVNFLLLSSPSNTVDLEQVTTSNSAVGSVFTRSVPYTDGRNPHDPFFHRPGGFGNPTTPVWIEYYRYVLGAFGFGEKAPDVYTMAHVTRDQDVPLTFVKAGGPKQYIIQHYDGPGGVIGTQANNDHLYAYHESVEKISNQVASVSDPEGWVFTLVPIRPIIN